MEPVELVILVGIQASGKTTFYRRHLADRYAHVSLDNWRTAGNVRGKEHAAMLDGLARATAAGVDAPGPRGVVVDNTNVTALTRRRYFECAEQFARKTGRPVRLVAYWFDADLDGCLARNEQRPKDAPAGTPYYVPPEAIRGFLARLEPPAQAEGFSRVFRVRIADDGRFVAEELPGAPARPPGSRQAVDPPGQGE